ncbi:hypothetical protein NEMIN01_2517, partial [Nematocida minor]|uniref:uncharacterized protein n=1 Tax=Nematocida minor TaxID=1912983 RepID=UPI00221ECCE4
IEFEKRRPDVYNFDKEKYKDSEFSDVHRYYSNLYILKDEGKRTSISCYVMNCQADRQENGKIKATWSARVLESVDEYTHTMLDEKLKKNAKKLSSFVEALESREHNKDSDLQCAWLSDGKSKKSSTEQQTSGIHIWLPNKACSDILDIKPVKYIAGEISRLENEMKDLESDIKGRENKSSSKAAEKAKSGENAEGEDGKVDENGSEEAKKMKTTMNSLKCAKTHRKTRLQTLYENLFIKRSERPDEHTALVVYRNVNESKSNMGANNEILDVLITCY